MGAKPERPELRVEGIDDKYSLIHLLKRNGVPYAKTIETSPLQLPEIMEVSGIEKLIAGIETAVSAATNRSVGFVLDADAPLIDRWRQVHRRLTTVEVAAPFDRPPLEGFIGESAKFKTRVGVWLMPDNEHDGKLEDFLETLVKDDDPLIGHARSATDQARALGATFSMPDTIKAVVYSWLAWQDEPGKPYGLAMKARYFHHDSPTAAKFVAWFKTLYGLDQTQEIGTRDQS